MRVYSFTKKVFAKESPFLPASVTAEGEGRGGEKRKREGEREKERDREKERERRESGRIYIYPSQVHPYNIMHKNIELSQHGGGIPTSDVSSSTECLLSSTFHHNHICGWILRHHLWYASIRNTVTA